VAVVVVHYRQLVDSTVQKRYGAGAAIEGRSVEDMRDLSEPARCGEVAEDSTVKKKYGVEVVIEEWWMGWRRYVGGGGD
jgi:hypothetical protein